MCGIACRMGSAGGGSDLCVGLCGGRMGLGLYMCAVTAGIGQVAVAGVGYGCEFAWIGQVVEVVDVECIAVVVCR